jgi:hypothetical protein
VAIIISIFSIGLYCYNKRRQRSQTLNAVYSRDVPTVDSSGNTPQGTYVKPTQEINEEKMSAENIELQVVKAPTEVSDDTATNAIVIPRNPSFPAAKSFPRISSALALSRQESHPVPPPDDERVLLGGGVTTTLTSEVLGYDHEKGQIPEEAAGDEGQMTFIVSSNRPTTADTVGEMALPTTVTSEPTDNGSTKPLINIH